MNEHTKIHRYYLVSSYLVNIITFYFQCPHRYSRHVQCDSTKNIESRDSSSLWQTNCERNSLESSSREL